MSADTEVKTPALDELDEACLDRESTSGLRDAVLGGLRDNAVLVAIVVLFVAAAFVAEVLTGVPVAQRLRQGSPVEVGSWALRLTLIVLAVSISVFPFIRLTILLRARWGHSVESVPNLAEAWKAFALRPTGRRFFRILIALLAFTLFFHVFVGLKGAIPLLNPFTWDEPFMRLDRALHFGHDPWRILHPLFGHPVATRMLDFFYYVWFPVKLGVVLWFAWMADGPERRQFFLAFFLTWILLGNVAALVFSSAGPCYYDLATGGMGPYQELMDYLHQVDAEYGLLAVEVQARLLEGYSSTEIHTVEGIAAMPSLHVALPFLFAFATARRSRIAAWLFTVFGVIIFLGSVHLGWHYAVDGYAAILGVVAVWWVAGYLVAIIPEDWFSWETERAGSEPF